MFHTENFDAIGVHNQVTVTDAGALDAALRLAKSEVARLDEAASRFRDDSELARLNRVGRAVVSPLLLGLIEAAIDAARRTEGLVDPTVGRSLRSLGYDRDFDAVVTRGAAPRVEFVPAAGWRSVRLDRDRSRVELRPGTELDLGATAKAHAADGIAAAIHRETGASALVSLGGDIAVAGPAPAGGWPVAVADDSRTRSAHAQRIAIHDGGLATSSTTVRRWRAGHVEVHHLVQPRTGAPAEETWRTASVAARSCLDANVAATAAILRGPFAPAWLESERLPARLVRPDGTVVTTAGWPAGANLVAAEA